MEKFIIDAVNDPITGIYVVLGGLLAAVVIMAAILHAGIQKQLEDQTDADIEDLMRDMEGQ